MTKKPLKPLKLPLASEPAHFGLADAIAVQALAQGKADEAQQLAAWKWILEGACGLPQWAYRDTPRETDIALGRHFVGQQLVGITKVSISALKKREEIRDHG